ncbi:MAG: serine hydrolase domain-containing protein [Candidatus Microsaccharimonas sp.]
MKTIPQHTFAFLDSWLEFRRGWVNVPGYSIAIAKKGKIVFSKSYGVADKESGQKLTPQHIFRVASHSKTFTATSVMQLAEAGKLRIDDHVVDYLDWLKKHKDSRWKTVTIRQLLSHGAGIIRDGSDADYWQLVRPFPEIGELHDAVLESKLILDPNVKLKYSNYGYGLLGEIIEHVSGESYADYVTKHIIKPLGLKNTYPEFSELIRSQMTSGYSRNNQRNESIKLPQVTTNALAAATGFCSTAEDLCLYMSAQTIGTGKLLSDESKREMQRMQWVAEPEHEGSYGLGFELDRYGERPMFGHSGGFPGYGSRTMAHTDDEYVVSAMVNSSAGEAGSMAKAITAVIDNLGDSEPKRSLLKFEGRFADFGSFLEVVVKGDELVLLWPNWWQVFEETEPLEYIDKSTLRVVHTNSYYSPGETIKYTFKGNKIDHIVNAGSTMFPSVTGEIPEQVWKKLTSKN